MNDQRPLAYIKHRLPGRMRLKIPQRRGDHAYFERLAEAFALCDGIRQLQLNPHAASLLVVHDEHLTLDTLRAFVEAEGLFRLEDAPPPQYVEESSLPHASIADFSAAGLSQLDALLRHASDGRFDMRSGLLLGLLALGIQQAAKGHIMAPAFTLFWHALELLSRQYERRYDAELDEVFKE